MQLQKTFQNQTSNFWISYVWRYHQETPFSSNYSYNS